MRVDGARLDKFNLERNFSMEIIKTTTYEKVEQIRYVAEDGKRFLTAEECAEYENHQNFLKSKLEGIESAIEIENSANFDGAENYESHSYYWYRPKSVDEIFYLEKYYGCHIHESVVGEWICIEKDDGGDAWYSRLEDGMHYVRTLLQSLGYEITVKEIGAQ